VALAVIIDPAMDDYSQKVSDLFDSQFGEWPLVYENYRQLENVLVRTIAFPAFKITLQYNPGRITSSSARVDAGSIEARPCFLCEKNRPQQQRGVLYADDYTILINPFPIFNRHLTIVFHHHKPQRIAGNFTTMLAMAGALPDYVVFYNGPECGASAPDHLHFQAGNRGFLPVENEMFNPLLCHRKAVANGLELWLWKNYGRGIITLKGSDATALDAIFTAFLHRFASAQPERPEPMLNILAYRYGQEWTVHIIPRKKHRPACYFAEENEKILLSPASVDMGGVFITPRERDFRRITAADIEIMLKEVCLGDEEILNLTAGLL
jgi:hypothetical protein